MPVVGYVTRTFASRTFSAPTQQGGSGGVGYVLRAADGRSLGMFKDVSAAQAAFRRFHGVDRILKWKQQNLQGDIEQHVAIGLPLDPKEIWGDNLQNWVEPSAVPGSVLLQNATTNTIRLIRDISGNSRSWREVSSPTLIDSDADFYDRITVNLDRGLAQGFDIDGFDSFPTPYTIVMVANNLDLPNSGILLNAGPGSASPLLITGSGGGNWRLAVGATVVLGPVGGTNPDILAVEADGTNMTFRVNGVDIGTVAAAPTTGSSPEIGGYAVDPFEGRIAFAMLSDLVDPSRTKLVQTERYLRSRYP